MPRRLYRKGRRAGSTSSNLAKARQAFRTRQVVKFSESQYAYQKIPYGEKAVFSLPAGTPDDLSAILAVVQASTNLADSTRQFCAARRIRNTLFFKNVSTYQVRIRASTWVARRDMPAILVDAGLPNALNFLSSYINNGFNSPYTETPSGLEGSVVTDVSTSMFQNPLWCNYMKCVKVRNHTLMPYRTKKFVNSVCVSRPAWIWAQGNARLTAPGNPSGVGYVAVKRWGGVTTRVMLFEFTGELINDATAAPNPVVAQSPVVLITQLKTEFEGAAGGEAVQNWTVGDGTKPALDEILTGQPWNYMFPTPSATASLGTSTVVGSLTSGL